MLRKKIYRGLCGALIIFMFASGNSTKAQELYDSVEEFVFSSYEIFLGRSNADDVGMEYWSYLIGNHNRSVYDYIIALISGEEFSSRDVNNDEFLNMIYNLFLGSEPTQEDRNYWGGKIDEKNNELNDIKLARIEVVKDMFNDNFFSDFSHSIGATAKFENLNEFGVDELRRDYDQDSIEYVNRLYRNFDEIGKGIYDKISEGTNREDYLNSILSSLPVFNDQGGKNEYEEIKRVTDDNVERIVYGLDYKIEIPYDSHKAVYISPFLQMNKTDDLNFITLGLSVTSRGLGKSITKAELVLGDRSIDLGEIYKDQSKYEDKGLSIHEFEVKIDSLSDLRLLDMILSTDISKIILTYDNDKTYVYSLYDKDRVKNTMKFMASIYFQILVPYLFEVHDKFNRSVAYSVSQ